MLGLALALAFGVMLSFALSDTLAKSVSSKIGSKRATAIMLAFSSLSLLSIFLLDGVQSFGYYSLLLSIASGIIYALAMFMLYKALETQQVSNTLSLAGIEWGLLTLFSVLVLAEGLTNIDILSIMGIFAGAFLVTSTEKFKFNRGYIPAIVAMIAFAISYMILVFAQQGLSTPLMPLFINRFFAFAAIYMYLRRSPEKGSRFKNVQVARLKPLTLISNAVMGILNGIGSLALLFLAQLGTLAIGSAIVAAEPAVVILFGYVFFKEHFVKHQILGFLLLIAGTIALTLA